MQSIINKVNKYLRGVRENVNIFLYDSKTRVMKILDVMSIIIAITGIGTLIYDHGFDKYLDSNLTIHIIFRCILAFYYIKFFLGYLYSFTPKKYFKEYRVNGILLGIILCMLIYDNTSSYWITEKLSALFDIDNPNKFSIIVEQISFFFLLIVELGRASSYMPSINISAPKLFVLSFVVLISVGTGLLLLPRMTVDGYTISFIDALFTATSASSGTGLTTIDISQVLSVRGQVVVMILIQLGGLNIITFASFFLILSKKRIGIKNQALIKDSLESTNFTDSQKLLREIFVSTILIEGLGVLIIFFNWSHDIHFTDVYQKFYYSLFHSISAFNNAGFSIINGGMTNNYCYDNPILLFTISTLVILGSLGFPVIKDIFGDIMFNKKRKINKKWSLHTKIAVYTTFILIAIGTLFFTIFEWNNILKDLTFSEKLISTVYNSVTTPTSGFNSVSFSEASIPTLIVFIILMFIGASPVSTGGGIKTTTFTILVLQAINTIKGNTTLNIQHQQVPQTVIFRAMTILMFSAMFCILGIMALSIIQPDMDIMDLVFEEMAAFTTTGLTIGITPYVNDGSKIVFIISMFLGRIGMLTFGFSLISGIKQEPDIEYPKARILV